MYSSDDKFKSGCGWPSFDDDIKGSVKRQLDADGYRTEIVCEACDAHLGHEFKGEGYTKKNVRHCVNSISTRFIPDEGETGRAVFSGGCFWGVEALLKKLEGVKSITAGFTGGEKKFPSYEDVCNGNTGHLEAVEILYNPQKVSFKDIAKLFFEIHDPTQENGQGKDVGEQYKSAIFYENDEQKKIALELINILKNKGLDVVTELRLPSAFWVAEDYHQGYYDKNGGTPHCHAYVKRFDSQD